MKKIFMTMVIALFAVTANAQWYLGGSVGVASVKNGNADAETVYKFVPDFGYTINDDWAIGVAVGYQKGACSLLKGSFGQDTETEVLQVSPYARYTFVKSKLVNVFIDGGVGLASYKDLGTEFQLGLKPGVAVNLNDKLSFVAHFGFVGFDTFSPKPDNIDNSTNIGVDLDGNNIMFGLYYNF